MSIRPGRACFLASLAAVLTPGVIAVPMAAFDPMPGSIALAIAVMLLSVLYGFPLALIHALLLGLPAYLMLSRRWAFRWWQGVVGGFLTGFLPLGISFAGGAILSSEDFASVFDILYLPLYLGACGAVGGLVFWRVLWGRAPRVDERLA